MKKTAALLLSLFLVLSCSTVAFAQTLSRGENGGNAVISATVPDKHMITVSANGADVMYNGVAGESFTVDRLSEPTIIIRANSGKSVKQVLLNGEDITFKIKGGYYTLEPVYEDKTLTVITDEEPTAPQSKTYTVKGTVKRKGEPVEGITLELRSTLKTNITDKKGIFSFYDVECGRHSLTALENGKIVGYVEFELTDGTETALSLAESGIYKVTADKNEIGINLTLNLNDDGTMKIDEISGVKGSVDTGSESLQTGDNSNILFWLLLLLISFAVVASVIVYNSRKKATKKS